MLFRPTAFALAVIPLFLAAPGSTQTLRYANQGDLKSLDPYTLNEVTTLAHLGHVYEGLIARDKNLNIVPALAERWDTPEPTRWRFHLRRGVKFHNGDDFTAVASPAPDRAFGCSSQPGVMRRIEHATSGYPMCHSVSEAWSFGPSRNDAVSILR